MTHYIVWLKDSVNDNSSWVDAKSPAEARRLVALNVLDASGAENAASYECCPSSEKMPPAGFIHRRLNGPVSITKR